MGDISVALSSTGYAIDYDGVSSEPNPLIDMDFPVCSANMGIGAFGFGPGEKEKMEHDWAQTCFDMAKKVIVDVDKRAVYIGDDGCWLVEYDDDIKGAHADRFFKRWQETGVFFFEFTLLDLKKQPLFCIKGFWGQNRWIKLEVASTPTCTIV